MVRPTQEFSGRRDDGAIASWREYDRAELDFQYSPSRSAHAFADTLRQWDEDSQRARAELAANARLDVPYGTRPRQKLDWFGVAERGNKPVHVFIHGGFWQESGKESASFLAPSHVASGHQFVAVGYTLAPDISLQGIVGEIDEAFRFVQENAPAMGGDPRRIAVSGHSAGAYLAASLMLDATARLYRPAAAILISGVYDLEPVRRSYVNDRLGLSARDAAVLSLTDRFPAFDVPVRIAVGGDETAEFRRQSGQLFDGWRQRLSRVDFVDRPGRDHFDILSDLAAKGPISTGIGASGSGEWPR